MQILLVVLVVIAIATIGYYAWLREKKRREALLALANRLGWQFVPARDHSHDEEYAHFEIFRRGHSRSAFNTMYGMLDIDGQPYSGKMGDFRYKVTSGSGKSTTTRTYTFSYLIVHSPFANAPDLFIRREGIFDKIAGAFGFDDIDFESSEFSKKFYVKSPDKRFAYDVIHPRMMEFLLATSPPSIDMEYSRCCISDGKTRWTPEQYEAHLQWIIQFFDLWPDHVTASLEDRA